MLSFFMVKVLEIKNPISSFPFPHITKPIFQINNIIINIINDKTKFINKN